MALVLGFVLSMNAQENENQNSQQQQQEMVQQNQDDGFKDIAFDQLNEKVQATVTKLAETCDLNALMYNAQTQVTKVKVTDKADQSKKVYLFDNEGVEVKDASCSEPKEEKKSEQVEQQTEQKEKGIEG